MRLRIARRLDDSISGTASGGSTTTLTATGDIARYPTTPQYLLGAELSTTGGTGSGQTRSVTTHGQSGGTVTLTVPTWSTVDSTTTYELHHIGGRGFLAAQYNDAINAAIDSLADSYFTDLYSIHFGTESYTNAAQDIRLPRFEYPMPSGYNYLYAVDYLARPPHTGNPLGNFDAYRAMGDATARTRLAQGFKVTTTGWYAYVVMGVRKVGSPTDTLTVSIMNDSSGPSGTAVTNGTATFDGSTLDTSLRYVPFVFDPPVYLTADTQYHIEFKKSTAVDAANYFQWAEDTGNSYGSGTAYTYAPSTYTAVSGSDFCFQIFEHTTDWVPLRPRIGWSYRRVGSDFIYIPQLPWDGTPIRIRGLAAIAEVTSDSSNIGIPPDYCEAFAINYLLSGRAGRALPDNYAQGAQLWAQQLLKSPRRRRALPANSVQVFA